MIPELDKDKKYYCLVPEQYTQDAEFLKRLQDEFFSKGHNYTFGSRDSVEESLAFFTDERRLSYWGVGNTSYEEIEQYAYDYNYEEFDLILEPTRTIDWSTVR